MGPTQLAAAEIDRAHLFRAVLRRMVPDTALADRNFISIIAVGKLRPQTTECVDQLINYRLRIRQPRLGGLL
jgi:hypothetical protein